MDTVAIFGVGLIGGSFALALRKAGFTGRIIGVSSDETIRAALALDVIEEALPAEEAAAQADLLYLAQPIHRIIDSLADLNAWVKPEALITDAGSTKQAIVDRASQVISRAQFLGGHPMAGRERRGVEAAEADLFQGRPYVLTPRSASELESPAAREFLGWIPRIGSFPVIHEPGRARPDRGLHLALAAARLHRPGRDAGRTAGAANRRLWAGFGRQHSFGPQFV